MAYKEKAQDYLDSRHGINKERDAEPNHSYYMAVLQSVFNNFYMNELRSERRIRDLEAEISMLKDGGCNNE